jgi:putative ABC transport system permease protein
MKLLATFFSTLILAARRLWSHRLLMLCMLVGLVTAVGLLSSIPLYADAVQHRLLQGELTEAGTHRPPFSFLWRYLGAWHGAVEWADYAPVDEYLSRQAPDSIGLPLESLVRHVKTDNLRLFAAADSEAFADRDPLAWISLGFITGLEDHVELLAGAFPSPQAPGEDIEVLVSWALAEQMGLQVGERFVLFGSGDDGAQIPVRIAGLWRPLDTAESQTTGADGDQATGGTFWFYQPQSFDEVLLTSDVAFADQVVPELESPIALAAWYQVFDGSRVRSGDVPGLLGQVTTAESRTAALLADTTLDVSPVEALQAYRGAARSLTVVLSVFSIPIIALILYFVALVAGLVVRRGQAEIAILRSRGTTRLQVLLIYLLEGLLVGAAGLAGGLALGRWLAQLMGRSRTFLDPALVAGLGQAPLPIVITPTALRYALLGVGLAVLALLIPALVASRHTIVTFRWERARALLLPLWQRYFLDFLLLIPPLYGWYLLREQDSLLPVYQSSSLPTDPFSNPLLFLVPALFCFSLALLFLRLFPWLMRILAWLAGWLPGTTLLLTLRQLARSAAQYTGPLLLLSLTLSLATFTASMAVTLDKHLWDQVYYQVGADLRVAEMGQSTEEPDQPGLLGEQTRPPAGEDDEGPRWLFLPVSAHLQVPGVQAAARVGNYGVTSNIGGRQETGRFLGIDRIDLPAVAFFRNDFAGGQALAGLMNRLAADRTHLLVSQGFMARYGLAVGDPLRLTIGVAGDFQEIEFVVAGPLDLFPTLYPQDGPFFVGSLEYVYEQLGGTYPYDVWLAASPGTSGQVIMEGISDLGISVAATFDAPETIAAEQTRPERQGLFGLLSVGFLAAATLTVLGFLVYAIVSFQRRFIELGTLRALGLSVGQMAGYLVGEQALLILIAGVVGTALGIWASVLFIPYLQVGTSKADLIPPFAVQIAWEQLWTIYAVFGVMFVIAVVVLVVLLVRIKIFEAVKLGEVG